MIMAETQSAVIKYQARDGQDIILSFDTIRKYLVQGKSEYTKPRDESVQKGLLAD